MARFLSARVFLGLAASLMLSCRKRLATLVLRFFRRQRVGPPMKTITRRSRPRTSQADAHRPPPADFVYPPGYSDDFHRGSLRERQRCRRRHDRRRILARLHCGETARIVAQSLHGARHYDTEGPGIFRDHHRRQRQASFTDARRGRRNMFQRSQLGNTLMAFMGTRRRDRRPQPASSRDFLRRYREGAYATRVRP